MHTKCKFKPKPKKKNLNPNAQAGEGPLQGQEVVALGEETVEQRKPKKY